MSLDVGENDLGAHCCRGLGGAVGALERAVHGLGNLHNALPTHAMTTRKHDRRVVGRALDEKRAGRF